MTCLEIIAKVTNIVPTRQTRINLSLFTGRWNITFVGRGRTFYTGRTPFSVLSPSVHFCVHWVGECAGENQAINRGSIVVIETR